MTGVALSMQTLDLRGLHPPEPMQKALEAIEALAPGDAVEIVTDREPMLLYRELDRRGYAYETRTDHGDFHSTVRRGGKE